MSAILKIGFADQAGHPIGDLLPEVYHTVKQAARARRQTTPPAPGLHAVICDLTNIEEIPFTEDLVMGQRDLF
jgi:hypothetical protein